MRTSEDLHGKFSNNAGNHQGYTPDTEAPKRRREWNENAVLALRRYNALAAMLKGHAPKTRVIENRTEAVVNFFRDFLVLAPGHVEQILDMPVFQKHAQDLKQLLPQLQVEAEQIRNGIKPPPRSRTRVLIEPPEPEYDLHLKLDPKHRVRNEGGQRDTGQATVDFVIAKRVSGKYGQMKNAKAVPPPQACPYAAADLTEAFRPLRKKSIPVIKSGLRPYR